MGPVAVLKRKFHHQTIVVFLAVFCLHLAFLFGCAKLLHFYDATLWEQVQKQDSSEYYSLAQSLLADGRFYLDGIRIPETFRTIGYPAIIAGVFAVTGGSDFVPGKAAPQWGDSFYIVLGFLALLAGATSALVVGIGEKLLIPHPFALAGGMLFGISPAVLFLPVSGMGSDMVFAFLFTLCLYLLLNLLDSPRPWIYALIIGVLMGIGTLSRPVGQFFSLVTIIAVPFMAGQNWIPRRREILIGMIALLSFLVTISPWLLRNYQVAGHLSISSIPVYSFAHYNIPAFLAHHHGTPEGEELKKISNMVGNPPDKLNRSFAFTNAYEEINADFLREYFAPYLAFHIFKTLPFFLGSGLDVSYAVLAIETQWRLHIPFLPHVDENLSDLVYERDFGGVLKNLMTYWPATLERIMWLMLFSGTLAAPFLTKNTLHRKYYIFGIAVIGMAGLLSSPVAQPRYRIPVEPIAWVSGIFVLTVAISFAQRKLFSHKISMKKDVTNL